MRIIGLTGGIACGKSTISLTLKSLGATIIDGDQLSRALTQPGNPPREGGRRENLRAGHAAALRS